MKNSKGFIQIIVIILVVLAIIAGVYYFGTKNKTITNDWKTYTNKTNGYSMKVPTYLPQELIGLDDMWFFAKMGSSSLDATHKATSTEPSISLQITSRKDAIQLNYDDHCKGKLLSLDQESPTISNISLVDGVEQYVQSSGIASRPTQPQVKFWDSQICFVKNGILYEIFYENDESTNIDPTLSQILSTFQFTK